MKKTLKCMLTLVAVLVMVFAMCVCASADEIVLPDIISEHMLLQQGEVIRLWGTAAPNKNVNVKITANGQAIAEKSVKAGGDGAFVAELPPMAPGGPYEIVFSTGTATVTVGDVLIGELWIQGGQSNMSMKVKGTGSYADDMLPKEPIDDIRLFINTKEEGAAERNTNLAGKWTIADSENVKAYSAMGWCSLKVIYDELQVPVGGICNAISGGNMTQFTGPEKAGEPGGEYYNTKIAPITKLSVRGIMWNQGSADRTKKDFTERFNTLIARWRGDSSDDHMYFVYMTLAPSAMKYYASWLGDYQVRDNSLARLRQIQTYYETEDTSFVVSIDRAPEPTDKDPIHPLNKKPVSDRLGRTVLGSVYGRIENWQSPLYLSSKKLGKSVDVNLSYAYGGLKTTDGEAPRCFMVAEEEGKFFAADAQITGPNTVRLTCSEVSNIKYIAYSIERYLFPYTSAQDAVIHTYPDVNLVNSENLPLAPFSVQVGEERIEKVFDNFAQISERVDFAVEEDITDSNDEKDIIASDWAKEEISKADGMGLIPDILAGSDLSQDITRQEFASVAVKVYEALADKDAFPTDENPFTDTNDAEILKAYNIGAVNGTSDTTYSPGELLNREQAATMLTRVFKRINLDGWTLATDSQFSLTYEKPALFADDADISDWAKESVYFMVANNILNGVDNNKFAPKNITAEEQALGYANATREQALIIAMRMVENLK